MSKGYQKQGPGKPQGFPGPSSDPRKFSTGARWALWNGRCETAGAQCAPLRKDRRGPHRGGFQPPEKPSPHRGEGVTAYAVTDEGVFLPPSLSQRGSVLRGGTPFGHPSDENGRGQDPPLRKDQGRSWKTTGAQCAPLRKDRRGPRRGGFQPPEKPSPHRGEGVTAYAVTDEGSFYPRPCPRGVLSCRAEPLSGILRMKTGGASPVPT